MPTTVPSRSIPRWAIGLAITTAVAGVLWFYPPIRVRRLSEVAKGDAFDPKGFADQFWMHDLMPALPGAHDAGGVLTAIRRDASAACQAHGRTVGLSRTCLYLVRGAGEVSAVEPTGCRVVLDGGAGEVVLATGLVFGTAVRDVTGTVDLASRTDSRELAAAATEINRLVHDRVIRPLVSRGSPGARVEFIAVGQVQGRLPEGRPWTLIPVQIALPDAPGGGGGVDPGAVSMPYRGAMPDPPAPARGFLARGLPG